MSNDESKDKVEGKYPDGNPKTVEGRKKSPLRFIPAGGLPEIAKVMALGAKKYGPFNWRDATVSSSVYYEAALRHLFAWYDGESTDAESGASHLAHGAACMLILLDAQQISRLNDDRPAKGGFAQAALIEKP